MNPVLNTRMAVMTLLNEYRLEIANRLPELARVSDWLDDLCGEQGVQARTVFHLQLVCDELITNTISYGYEDEADHPILVTVKVGEKEIELSITDDGDPFDPFQQETPDLMLAADERPVGGLGIHFVKRVMDEVAYERLEGYNRVRMLTKREKQAEGSE